MNIGIDISQIVYETGASVYTRNLVKHLIALDSKNTYKLFAGTLRRKKDIRRFVDSIKAPNVKSTTVVLSPQVADVLWNKLHIFPPEYVLGSLDVFHASDWTQPRTKAFCVTTVHDLAPILYPKQTASKIVSVHKRRLRWVKKEADAIIAPSESTKSGLIELGFEKDKIHVIYEAAEEYFKPEETSVVDKVRQKYHLSEKYFLMIGTAERKNIARTIEAFNKLNLKDTQLAIVGRKPQESLPTSKNVVFLGHVDNEERPALYSGAQALVYPSLYEGFGLPILEAFACGCPVITSNVSSTNTNEISDALTSVTNQADRLRKKGFNRLKHFDWDTTARQTLKIYERASQK
jgi:glycosyltransferase involved in cell wall biosynthesis